MANMSYCRFENTVGDLQDCFDHIHDDVDGYELEAREELIELCKQIVEAVED